MNIAEGIYVTLSRDLMEERGGTVYAGYKLFVNVFKECEGTNDWFFYWRLPSKPKKSFVWVYFIIGNKVRFRARFFEYIPGCWIEFRDAGAVYTKQWMMLYDFEKLPRPYEIKKGFQGFRYKYDEF